MDALGHVNDAECFRCMEQARVAWLDALNIPMLENGPGPVIVKAPCDFLEADCLSRDRRDVDSPKRAGRSSITVTRASCLEGEPAVRFANGEAAIVWVDHARGKPAPFPERVLRHLK